MSDTYTLSQCTSDAPAPGLGPVVRLALALEPGLGRLAPGPGLG